MEEIIKYTENIFENIKHIDEEWNEYWLVRDLQLILQYKEWRKFLGVLEKARTACNKSKNKALYHFVQVDKMIKLSKGGERIVDDYKLSRYACYLIVQNSGSRKEVVALGQNREDILDNMCSEELIANLFRISQTESKLKRDNISSETKANETHYIVGKNIRETILKNGGIMPEDMLTPDKSLKELEKDRNKKLPL